MNDLIQIRLHVLYKALWHCSQYQEVGKGYIFSRGERIAINQERGALLSQLSDDPEADVRYLKISEDIEKKVNFINDNMNYEPIE
jgi:hypothetical protein